MLLTALLALALAPSADYYVSTSGNDAWSGKLAEPSPQGDDGPFATVDRARKVVRGKAGTRPVVVLIRGGTYELNKPLTFTPEDSGKSGAPIIYEAYPGERPVLSGGKRLAGWTIDGRGHWRLEIPLARRGAWPFSQLFVAGQRRYRPRLPKDGYHRIAGEVPPEPPSPSPEGGSNRFRFPPGTIQADWVASGDVEVLCFRTWKMSRMRLSKVDEASRIVTFSGHTPNSWTPLGLGDRFLIENVPGGPQSPGEWYLDQAAGVLTYFPLPGEDKAKTSVVAPWLERLVVLRGEPSSGRRVEHITFRGLTFAHGHWGTPKAGHAFHQADVDLPGAFQANWASEIVLEGCAVAHVGAFALEFGAGCKKNRVERCLLTDLGGGGIKIGEIEVRDNPAAVASGNLVRETQIRQAGRIHPPAPGIWIGQSSDNIIERNTIDDLYFSGISVGWTWGYAKSLAVRNRIEGNIISRVGQGVLSDLGGIYTLGISPGTLIQGNRVRDVQAFDYGGWGVYLDEGSSGVVVRENVVTGTTAGGFHLHFGKDNLVENNVFGRSETSQLVFSKPESRLGLTFRRNLVFWDKGTLLGGDWSKGGFSSDENLYWDSTGAEVRFGKLGLADWRKLGHDRRSVVADPRFRDSIAGDFRLNPGSPAARLGFRADGPNWGPPALSVKIPDVPRAFPAPPPSDLLADDFESTGVGDQPLGATVNQRPPGGTILVSDLQASKGKQSLRFTDASGIGPSFFPYLYYLTDQSKGSVTVSFDLRMEPGAVLWHDWRDSRDEPYHGGPTFRIEGDGTLKVHGESLTRLPLGRWVHFDLTTQLGGSGRFDLTVQVTGEKAPRRFPGRSCPPSFRSLKWLGFFADGERSASFFLDNLRLSTAPESH